MFHRKWLQSLFLATATIVGGGLLAYLYLHPPAFLLGKRSQVACIGKAESFSFQIHPTFYLNKKFLPPGPLSEKDLLTYAENHLRYIQTTLPAFKTSEAPKFATIPAGASKISNIKIEDATYPLALKTTASDIAPFFIEGIEYKKGLDSSYMLKAMKIGSTSLEDPAYRISYDLDAKVLLCENESQNFANQIQMPVDPYLAFWFVPDEKRIIQHNTLLKKDERITPCATNELLYDNGPLFYWYYWSLDGKTCEDSLVPGSIVSYDIQNKKAHSFETKTPFDLSFLDKSEGRPLKMAVNLTLMDDESLVMTPLFGEDLKAKVSAILAKENLDQARAALEPLSIYDVTLRTGIVFAWSVKLLSNDFKLEQVDLAPDLIQWRLTGTLRASGKPFDISVTLGSVLETMPSFQKFYKNLNVGLAESDIVYFGGHSGVGQNLTAERVYQPVANLYHSLPQDSIPSHQLVILMSCYSLHYFPLNALPKPDSADFIRDVLFTASTPSGYDAKLLVGLLEQVDKYLAKGTHLPFEKWPEHYQRDVFLYHAR